MKLAWLIAFVSSIVSNIRSHNSFPNFVWWVLVYMFFCILGVLITEASMSEHTYHVAVSDGRNELGSEPESVLIAV